MEYTLIEMVRSSNFEKFAIFYKYMISNFFQEKQNIIPFAFDRKDVCYFSSHH
jgi:hypothetical protein